MNTNQNQEFSKTFFADSLTGRDFDFMEADPQHDLDFVVQDWPADGMPWSWEVFK